MARHELSLHDKIEQIMVKLSSEASKTNEYYFQSMEQTLSTTSLQDKS